MPRGDFLALWLLTPMPEVLLGALQQRHGGLEEVDFVKQVDEELIGNSTHTSATIWFHHWGDQIGYPGVKEIALGLWTKLQRKQEL